MTKIAKLLWTIPFIAGMSSIASANDQLGTLVGGVAGGIIGNSIGHGSTRTAATIGGVVLGSVVGNSIAQNERMKEMPYSPCHRLHPHHSYTVQNTFIGQDGRLCRHSLLTDEYGEHFEATYCCYRMSPHGYCTRWQIVS